MLIRARNRHERGRRQSPGSKPSYALCPCLGVPWAKCAKLKRDGGGVGKLGAKRAGVLTLQKPAPRSAPTLELKGPLAGEPPDKVRMPFPIQ